MGTFNLNRAGFSLIEMLVVLNLIVLITGIGFFGLSGFKDGQALVHSRSEVAALAETARSLAIYSGDEMKLKFDSGLGIFWVEDPSGVRKTDSENVETGIRVTGPSEVIFRGTGRLASSGIATYTFQNERSGKSSTLRIHPKTGSAEAV